MSVCWPDQAMPARWTRRGRIAAISRWVRPTRTDRHGVRAEYAAAAHRATAQRAYRILSHSERRGGRGGLSNNGMRTLEAALPPSRNRLNGQASVSWDHMTSSAPPPLNALRTFEAFARHRSMTDAASELCVTHGAVSRQVATLQAHLGV